jgi:hypothetical protein
MSELHQSMSIERVCRELPALHGQVIRNWGRIEVRANDGTADDACVLISRAELECLERALELFCESPGGKEICKELEGIANRSTYRAGNAIALITGETIAANAERPTM